MPYSTWLYCVLDVPPYSTCPRYRSWTCACMLEVYRASGCISPLRYFAHIAKEITVQV